MRRTVIDVVVPNSQPAVTFVDEAAERLLIGQVLVHPDRFRELALTEDHFHAQRRLIYRVLLQRAARGLRLDAASLFADLWDARLLTFAADCVIEWGECPMELRELAGTIDALGCRRRMGLA